MTLEFQPMTAADLDQVVAVEQRSYPFPWTHGVFVDSLAAGYRAWVAREKEVIIAYALMMVVLDEVHLLNITVVPERQGQGFGGTMLTHLLADADERGCKFMFLEVRPSNINALEMYRRFGFVVIGERRGYYPAANGREDAIVMTCDIGRTALVAGKAA
ncbi:Ribosomal-protein-S18p-alanine acetyltransferase [Georgfuchsia toluolica]|uniref:[Ribosomal protein bS18]-alanine N-acetyltransferase n=1 Tax=Georgfuchsia toluolica TaxID=424218 RepID=A0A916J5L2_9PROT|nr:ribosomal protein S18-alanine N-acetyltransferase [Georgfuchsia toluolica]CAG4882859.1 Ribosomal-protein-S18p-alanine acetyltransferase [Georgfuchsia toluolica]